MDEKPAYRVANTPRDRIIRDTMPFESIKPLNYHPRRNGFIRSFIYQDD